MRAVPDAPSYSAGARAKTWRVLEEKGHVRHEEESLRLRIPADGGARDGAAFGDAAHCSRPSLKARWRQAVAVRCWTFRPPISRSRTWSVFRA